MGHLGIFCLPMSHVKDGRLIYMGYLYGLNYIVSKQTYPALEGVYIKLYTVSRKETRCFHLLQPTDLICSLFCLIRILRIRKFSGNAKLRNSEIRYIYFILSSEINAYQKQIKMISITSLMI